MSSYADGAALNENGEKIMMARRHTDAVERACLFQVWRSPQRIVVSAIGLSVLAALMLEAVSK